MVSRYMVEGIEDEAMREKNFPDEAFTPWKEVTNSVFRLTLWYVIAWVEYVFI